MINDHFQNKKQYNIPPAQLVIADIPYNVGKDAYGSSPKWYIDGDNKNGESNLAGKQFFDTDKDFRIPEFFAFCGRFAVVCGRLQSTAICGYIAVVLRFCGKLP